MEMSVIFYGIFAALGYVLLQSLFILGVRIAAKGGTEKLPDGTDKDSEMILYPLFKYLTRVKRQKIYYSGDEFDKLVERIRSVMSGVDLIARDNRIQVAKGDAERASVLKELNGALATIDKKIEVDATAEAIRFYKIDEEYVVNKYFRKPVIQCPICMASYWSTFSYWIPVIYFYGFNFWVLYLGVLNICAVSSTNWLLWMKGSADESRIVKG